MVEINGVQLEFSVMNPNDMQRYADTQKELSKKAGELKERESSKDVQGYIEVLRGGCEIVHAFFDSCFGEGTSNLLFGRQTDFEKSISAYRCFEEQLQKQVTDFEQKAKQYEPNRTTKAP